MQKTKIIIIGAGISGLYLTYRLLKLNIFLGHEIVIVEKLDHVGGRLKTFYDIDLNPINFGAARFHKKQHVLLNQIIEELNLESHTFYYKNLNSQNSCATVLDKVCRQTANKGQMAFAHAIQQVSGAYALENIIHAYGYDVLSHKELSFNEAIKILADHPETVSSAAANEPEWAQLKNGFQTLAFKLYHFLINTGVKFYFNHELVAFFEKEEHFLLEFISKQRQKTMVAEQAILCIPQNALKALETNVIDIPNISQSICTVSLFKLFLYYEDVWWQSFSSQDAYITAPFPLRKIFLSASKKEILIYCDSSSADYWNNFLNTPNVEGIHQLIKSHLSVLLSIDIKNVPEPISLYYHYWPEGVSFWKKDSTHTPVSCYRMGKRGKASLICDMYSSSPGWIEGALENIEAYLARDCVSETLQYNA